MLLGFCVPFLVVLYLQYCMLEDSPTKCEMCDIFISVRGMRGKNLVGRNHIWTDISVVINENTQFWKMSQSEFFTVLWALWALPSQLYPRVLLGNHLGLHLGLYVCLWLVRVKDKPPFGG